MEFADRVCDLECRGKVKESPQRHEFVGPVKIILIDPAPGDNTRKAWGSAFLTLAILLMGVTVFTVFFFTLKFKLPSAMNIHVFLCTMGFQLFMPSGIFMHSSLFGGSMHLKAEQRKSQHFLLEVFGILTGVVGTLFVVGNMECTVHALTGLFASCLLILTGLIGPIVYISNTEKMFGGFTKKIHKFFALPTFILSTVCFVLGLLKDSFINWVPIKHLHYILIVFTILYSVAVLVSVFLRSKYGY